MASHPPERYCRLPLADHPVGAGMTLLYCSQATSIAHVPTWVADAVMSADSFQSVSELVERLRARAPAVDGELLRETAEQLVKAPLFVTRSRFVRALRAGTAQEPRPRLRCMGMLTRDRPQLLLANLESFVQNHLAHGRDIDYVVADDSPRARDRRRLRGALAQLASRYGVRLRYAGREEKVAYAQALARASGVDPAVVRFGLLGRPGCGTTVGANRNALLLHRAGSPILMVDDDISCRYAVHPDRSSPGLRLGGSAGADLWLYPGSTDPLREHRRVDVDSIGIHEDVLGMTVGTLARAVATDEVDVSSLDAGSLAAFLAPTARVIATGTGVIGDSGLVDDPTFPAVWCAHALQRAADPDRGESYGELRRSRQCLRVASRLSLRVGDTSWMSGCAAYTNAIDLLPFVPTGRGEDGLYAAVNKLARHAALFASLPWAAHHQPPSRRRAASARSSVAVDSAFVVMNVIGWLSPRTIRDPGALARHLIDVGQMSRHDFADQLRAVYVRAMADKANRLRALAAAHRHDMPPLWSSDLDARAAAVERAAFRPIALAEIVPGRRGDDPVAIAQSLVGSIGRWYAAWPALNRAARPLAGRGIRLATVLGGGGRRRHSRA